MCMSRYFLQIVYCVKSTNILGSGRIVNKMRGGGGGGGVILHNEYKIGLIFKKCSI